jgi:phytoene/squalene synthetase
MNDPHPNQELAASITRAASKQTYYTIRYLVDRALVSDAFRAYAYFRWVDDWLDIESRAQQERIDFINRQTELMNRCYHGEAQTDTCIEETMLIDLIRGDQAKNSGLQSYIRNMMAVMSFDAKRRGQVVSHSELVEYSRLLATAVTEALHHFIGHDSASPHDETRYLAVTGAHLVHMLRDTAEDVEAGYYNIPREITEASGIAPQDFTSKPYRAWVRSQARLARSCFEAGRDYLTRVANGRCRIAGCTYIARFEGVLDTIESDNYTLHAKYPDRGCLHASSSMLWSALSLTFSRRTNRSVSQVLPAR